MIKCLLPPCLICCELASYPLMFFLCAISLYNKQVWNMGITCPTLPALFHAMQSLLCTVPLSKACRHAYCIPVASCLLLVSGNKFEQFHLWADGTRFQHVKHLDFFCHFQHLDVSHCIHLTLELHLYWLMQQMP